MSVKRSIIAPAIIALSAAGTVAAGSATVLATTGAASVSVTAMQPNYIYEG